jgi:hypothetical protein
MASVLGYKTLADVMNQYTSLDANGLYLEISEVLNRACPLLRIMPMVESNQVISHIGSRRSYLVTPGTRSFNKGIVPSASHVTPLTEGIALYEDYCEIDADLCRIQNNPARFRQDEVLAKFESFKQKLEYGWFYGSIATDGNAINGLVQRFNSLTHRPNGDTSWPYNIWDGGVAAGAGAVTTSIWLLELGVNKVYGIYPKNMPAGFKHTDLGEVTKEAGYAESSAGSLFQVYRDHLQWFIGLFVGDERCVQRYANIATTGSANIFDEEIIIKAKNQLPGMGEAPGTVMLVDRTIKSQIDIRAVSTKMNTYFRQDENTGNVWGTGVTRFQNIPVLVAEKLLDTETAIT